MANIEQRFILTGGPGSGKSTLIKHLSQRGYACSSEAGRTIILQQIAIGGDALPWKNRVKFAELMLSLEICSWHIAKKAPLPTFFDRGIPDIAGYLSLCGLPVPSHLKTAIDKFRYENKVFIAPPWPEIYTQDTERKQSFTEAQLTYELMLKTYQKYDYQLIELPRVSVNERANWLISKL